MNLLRVSALLALLSGGHAFRAGAPARPAAPLRSRRSNVRMLPADGLEQLQQVQATAEGVLPFLSIGIGNDGQIDAAFRAATFAPQPFWMLMILLPKWSGTKKIMGPLPTVLGLCLIHLFIVVVSATQPSGTAPISEFAGVFDPNGDPQSAMMGMMGNRRFVSEEWSHVLLWDIFVGRWIWLDGLRRNIFTAHSVLFCNLIGPPGLLLHAVTCVLTGKALPGLGEVPEDAAAEEDSS